MQREIRRKTVTYGFVAAALAVLLTALCFEFGLQPYIPIGPISLETFSSREELENFLSTNMEQAKGFGGQYWSFSGLRGEIATLDAETAPSHSTTNIQVAGVGEADVVKTDGEYLYVVSGNSIYILKGYPPQEADVLSEITLDETDNIQVYVQGDRLAVLGGHFGPIRIAYMYSGEFFLRIYDISDRTSPALERTLRSNGTLSGSRMIGDYIYAVVNQLAVEPSYNETDFDIVLPIIHTDSTITEIEATEIRYVNITDVFYYFTTIIAVNIANDVQGPTYETILTGSTASMYVSQNNMYLTVPNTHMWLLTAEVIGPRDKTLIYRVRLDEDEIISEAEGSVPGYVLNQFSMDEYNGFFRIATTDWTQDGSTNNLYVLNMNLTIVGELLDLAPSESIYSARFMDDRCYLVTFEKVDPLFVIDLEDPYNPEVLGKLKIPGYSDYLHPYDENHLIGVGKETIVADWGDFSWYQGVKISLFDVSDVENPKEMDKYVIGDRGTESPVLRDHKAFLFDKTKNLLVLPVLVAEIDEEKYPGGHHPSTHGEYVWQGAYVFDISLEQGLRFRGGITHQDDTSHEYENQVQRILYIEDVLYTVSQAKVKMNDIETLQLLNEVEL